MTTTQLPFSSDHDLVADQLKAYARDFGVLSTINRQLQVTQALLQESEKRFELAMQAAQEGIWDWNVQTGELYLSPRCGELLGYRDRELDGTPEELVSYIHPSDLAAVMGDLEACRDGKLDRYEKTVRIRHRDGNYRCMRNRCLVVRNPASGSVERLVGTAVDISHDVRLQARLEGQTTRLRSIINTAADGIVMVDSAGRILEFSPAAEKMFGYSREQVVGRSVTMLMSEKFRHLHEKLLTRSRSEQPIRLLGAQHEAYALRGNGEEFPVSVTVQEARIDGERFLTATLRDITESRRAEQAMVEARDAAEAASRAKSSFLANMSHEIRTPLTAILGFAEVLLEPGQSEEERLAAVQTIIKNGQHLKGLLADILDFSKIEAARLQVEETEINIPEFLRDIGLFGRTQAEDKELAFAVSIDTPLPASIRSDPTRIKQILINLISNAVKFTDAPGSILLSISLDQGREQLEFALSDTGIGITREEMRRLFRPFVQADVSTTRRFGGTGLGLVISRTLAQLLGGALRAESSPGEGSLFVVTVATGPLDGVSLLSDLKLRFLAESRPQARTPAPSLAGCILLAEDNPDNQDLIRLLVRRTGADLVVANNGQEAVEAAQDAEFDLVLMDMQMPVMKGLDATALLRLSGFTAPIVALTASATESDRMDALREGCDGFLTKPIETKAFFDTLARYLVQSDEVSHEAWLPPLGEDPVYRSMCQDFLSGLPADVESIKASIAEENWGDARSIAHQLKGAGGSFGRPDVSQASGRIEAALIQKRLTALPSLLQELEHTCRLSH